MGDRLYAQWKHAIVDGAFRQRGLAPQVAPLRRVAPASRRRAVLTARRQEGGRVALGYHARRSRRLVAIEECPVLLPDIAARLPALAALAAAVAAGGEARLTVLATPGGLDVAVDAGPARVGASAVARLAAIAAENGLARIAVGGETLVERTRPLLAVGEAQAAVPPGAFVQAVAAAEQEMRGLVLAAVGEAGRVADLYCGVGTFALALARRAPVLAVDASAAAIAALGLAARRTGGLAPVETRVRDLAREPLSARELDRFDAVVLDPPRAGAREQAHQLARARVPTAVAVSCDPGTLARDVRILVDGGYALEAVTPIDQFLYSAHVEAVAVLRRRR
jgi:23S rRNA (uracil1939-C5)-methyltransferase